MTRSASMVTGLVTSLVTRSILSAVLLLPLAALAQGTQGTPSPTAIADQVMTAMGGQKAWDDTHYLRFTFAGRRTHHLGQVDRPPPARRDGPGRQEVRRPRKHQHPRGPPGWTASRWRATSSEWLERGYGAWVNDTYWLLMPYKLQDPGVNLAYAGEETIDGKTYDKLDLTFGRWA